MLELRRALENLVDAWEALPGGKNYSPQDIECWMANHLKPAIDAARKVLRQSEGSNEGRRRR